MKKIKKISDIIDYTIDTIKIIDANEPVFHIYIQELLNQLSYWNSEINEINLFDIEEEIGEYNKQFSNKSETVDFLYTYFSNLFIWKEGINTMQELLSEINTDIQTLDFRSVLDPVSATQTFLIKKEYQAIATKLQKLKYDYKEITNKFIKGTETTHSIVNQEIKQLTHINYKLDSTKKEAVAEYLNSIIDKGYFLNTDPENPYLKVDILNAVSTLFSCNLSEITTKQEISIPVAQQDEHPSEIIPIEEINITPNENSNKVTLGLASFLLSADKATLALKIKEIFNIEKGKSIRLLIKALEESNPKLIALGNRDFKALYLAIKESFGRDIGSYQSVKGYKYQETSDEQDFTAIQLKLNHILIEISVQKTQLD